MGNLSSRGGETKERGRRICPDGKSRFNQGGNGWTKRKSYRNEKLNKTGGEEERGSKIWDEENQKSH